MPTTPVFALCDEYVRAEAQLDPVSATASGLSAAGLPAGTDYGPEGIAARIDLKRDTLRRLAELPVEDDADRLAAMHLRERLEADLAWYETGEPLRSVRAPFGLIQMLCNSPTLLPRADQEQWRLVTERVAAIPRMLASWRQALATGIERGLVAARRQAVAAAEQAAQYAERRTFQSLVDEYGDGPLAARLADAATAGHAALAETARWLTDEYAPKATEVDAVGPERYAVAARLSWGVDPDPVEAYEWAWAELHRLEEELAAEAHRVLPGASIEEAIAHLDASAPLTGVDAYRRWLQDRHDEAIERLHGVHFDIAEPLRRVEVVALTTSTAGSAYYTPPTEDFSRPGRTWWPVAGRERFAVWSELTTVFHEGVPGHHLQLGQLLLEGERLSRFARLSRVSAYSEGWALYAERLADELGWHDGVPGGRLGMLKASALRAARVVIDIGFHLDLPMPADEVARHGPRWTYETATEVLRDRGRIAAHRLHPEVLRYAGWPAQASSYKLGERAWLAAREQARARSGPDFDLKDWHTRALALGPVGLGTLAEALASV